MAKANNGRGKKAAGKRAVVRCGAFDVTKRDELVASVFNNNKNCEAEKLPLTAADGTKRRLEGVVVGRTGKKLGMRSYAVGKNASQMLVGLVKNPSRKWNPDVAVAAVDDKMEVAAILKRKERIAKSVGLARKAVGRELK